MTQGEFESFSEEKKRSNSLHLNKFISALYSWKDVLLYFFTMWQGFSTHWRLKIWDLSRIMFLFNVVIYTKWQGSVGKISRLKLSFQRNVHVLKPGFFKISVFLVIMLSNQYWHLVLRHGARIPNDDDVENLQVKLNAYHLSHFLPLKVREHF